MYIIPAETAASEAAASATEETCLLFFDKGTLVDADGWETMEAVQNVPDRFTKVTHR